MQCKRRGAAAAVIEKCIYVVGGSGDQAEAQTSLHASDSIEMYDPRVGRWMFEVRGDCGWGC